MQFSCESCKAQLQIADEKVRGRRLIVRCKRCGAKIALADPLLSKSGPRLLQPAPAPPDTDPDRTRAMDSDVLERALQASRADERGANGSPPTQRFAAPPPAVPPNPAVWFAMVQGKQTGPLTRAEVEAGANDGAIGPRTYVWCEGMDSWQRAKDVLELAEMFPPLPAPPPRPSPAQPAPSPAGPQPAPGKPQPGPREPQAPSPRSSEAPVAADGHPPPAEPAEGQKDAADPARTTEPTPAKEEAQSTPPRIAPPVVARAPMFESAAPPHGRRPFVGFFALSACAVAVVLFIILGSASRGREGQPAETQARAEARLQGAEAAPAPSDTPKPAEAAPPVKSADTAGPPAPAAIGLTAEQVRRKLDENKPALQGCIDEALARDPNLRLGRIHVATTIAPSGQVTAARIDRQNVDESPLGSCLKQATRKIVFPQFSGTPFDVDIPISVRAGE